MRTVVLKASVGVFPLYPEQHFSVYDPAASPLSPYLLILSVVAFEAFFPSLQAREAGQCLAMEVDSVSLRMKERITLIPEMQNISKEVGQLTKVRITFLYRRILAWALYT